MEWLKEPTREADLRGFTGAWTGLAVAEALLLSDRPMSQIRLAACLSTQSFAVARMMALWDRVEVKETLQRQAEAVRLVNGRDDRRGRLEKQLWPVWEALASGKVPHSSIGSRRLAEAVHVLSYARTRSEIPETSQLAPVFDGVPGAEFLSHLDVVSPEDRVRIFDSLVQGCANVTGGDAVRRSELAFLAGYLATVVAGGSASLTLTSETAKSAPEITAWAYALGGVGESVVWTSSFEGLGRLVARELERPFHLGEAPLCDFAVDEAAVLVDRELSDPLVRLRIKQTRVATVALLPGVNIAVPLREAVAADDRRSTPTPTPTRGSPAGEGDILGLLAAALWPRIEAHLEQRERLSGEISRPQARRRRGSQNKLL